MTRTIKINWSNIVKYLEENQTEIPHEAGVYEILVEIKDKNEYDRHYIGQTDDLRERFLEHLSEEEKNENIYNGVREFACGFDFTIIEDENERKDAELGLFQKHKYDWNKNTPEGSGQYSDIEIIEE